MQTIRHNGMDVLYNVQKLPRNPGDAKMVFRVKFGGNVARHVDVPLPDYEWPKSGGSDVAATKHRLAMPAKALEAALAVVLPVPVPLRAEPAAKSEKKHEPDEKHK
jgi:hypothetical protein